MHFDKLSANGKFIKLVAYPLALSLSKHERIIFRVPLKKDYCRRQGHTRRSICDQNHAGLKPVSSSSNSSRVMSITGIRFTLQIRINS
jgi:hypothetical protein